MTPMQEFDSFSIVFYYIISTKYLKVGELFCRVHISGLSLSVHRLALFSLWFYGYISVHCAFLDHWNTKKVFGDFDNIFHVYLMREFQKYGRNWILTVAFWGQTKAGQKCAARWAELAMLVCRQLKKPSWEFNFNGLKTHGVYVLHTCRYLNTWALNTVLISYKYDTWSLNY